MPKITLKVVQKYEANAEGKHVVRLRITADRLNRFVATSVEVTQKQFNKKARRENLDWVKASHPNQSVFNDTIRKLWDRAVQIVGELGPAGTADQVKYLLLSSSVTEANLEKVTSIDFITYCAGYIQRREVSSTTETYKNAFKAFCKFVLEQTPGVEPRVDFDKLTIAFLKGWRTWALARLKNNTAWLYHARLKSMYLQALEDLEGLAGTPSTITDPFRRVKIVKVKTQKARLYEDEIQRLSSLDLKWGKPQRQARDICLMMYYAHGMRIGDALRLRLRNYVTIETGEGVQHRLIYTMGKTGKSKNVLLPSVCTKLLGPYIAECSGPEDTLFPFLRKIIDAGYKPDQLRVKIKSKAELLNQTILRMGQAAGIDKAMSAHIFRHSFADLARRNKMDIFQIQKALGHDQLSTTQIYLEDLEESSVDELTDLFK